ncbi:DNA-processing protein DprA [Adlercreutzia sp. ZJ304]|uniref:DNA-processing protein DprA n=1 Tax=Adlercreutzia sp. ZJ304 TaxID=2709791 RepID=UPI0013EE0F90|nr:DNA-processing protein DprA [Adlercreutzia sp. ZJ304]
MEAARRKLTGERNVLHLGDKAFPEALCNIPKPPKQLFIVGSVDALSEGLAIVGARKATPYGKTCATRFAKLASERGISIISGGARGCDTFSHEAALQCGGKTVVFLGGGCDCVYPPENFDLFQRVVDGGGAVVSEQDWTFIPQPWTFRERNRLIAGLAKATLIVEAGLPSGTFSTADEALAANREVLVVPGSITSRQSLGANRLIYQGATPIVDDDTFYDQLFTIFGCLKQDEVDVSKDSESQGSLKYLLDSVQSKAMSLDEMIQVAREAGDNISMPELMLWLTECSRNGLIAQYFDGRYGPATSC